MNRAMTGAATTQPLVNGAASRRDQLLLAVPVLALLCIQVGLFVWAAPRGIDLTDESYYLLSYLHWRELSATVTFFGAYFEWPFRVLGQNIAAIRILGMSMLMFAGGFAAWQIVNFGYRSGREAARSTMPAFVVAGMASALLYYSFATTLRAPSYNLLVLFCLLIATGLMLYIADGCGSRRQSYVAALFYGVALGTCGLAKATSAVAMLVCHGAFFFAFQRQERNRVLISVAIVGVLLNFLLLQSLKPQWIEALREGVQLIVTMDSRYAKFPFTAIWNAALYGAEQFLPAFFLAAVSFLGAVWRWGRIRREVMSWLVLLVVVGVVVTIEQQSNGKVWWALLLFGACLLWAANSMCSELDSPLGDGRRMVGLSTLLFALPFAYSIGTNGDLIAHARMASGLCVIAVMLPLVRLSVRGLISRRAFAMSLAVLCVPVLVIQTRSLRDPAFTYRLRTGLIDQQESVSLGAIGDRVLVDSITRDSIQAVVRAMHEAGYRPGDPILDFTGNGPGLVYALGGRPVGVAWLLGGYPGSEMAAARLISQIPVAMLTRTWIVSADGHPGALKTWSSLLRQQTGGASHQVVTKVAFDDPHLWIGPRTKPVTLTLWKPIDVTPASPSEKNP